MTTDKLRDILRRIIDSGKMDYENAKWITNEDWRGWLRREADQLNREEFESFFYFLDGFVDAVEEGYEEGAPDAEFFERAKSLFNKLN